MTPEEEFAAAFNQASADRTGADEAPTAQADYGDAPARREAAEPPPVDELAELKRRLADAEHRERSASSRVSSFHKKYNEAQAQLAELQRQASAPEYDAEPTDEDDDEALAVLDEMPELGRLVDRLVALRVEESVDVVKRQVQQVEAGVQPLHQQAEREALRSELAVVEAEFPQWREIVYGDEFKSWIDAKPASIRDAYDNADTAADGLEFLRMYDRERGASTPTSRSTTTTKQDRLARAVGVPSRAASAPLTGMPPADDFEASFNYFAKQRRQA